MSAPNASMPLFVLVATANGQALVCIADIVAVVPRGTDGRHEILLRDKPAIVTGDPPERIGDAISVAFTRGVVGLASAAYRAAKEAEK